MIESNLSVFIDCITHYFEHLPNKSVMIGTPYLVDETDEIAGDYTGVIAISGSYHGNCYFTAPRDLIADVIIDTGESETSEEMVLDTVGEITNTLSGNARKTLGADFIISIPKVFNGTAAAQLASDEEQHTYAIPIRWQDHEALLGVRLESARC